MTLGKSSQPVHLLDSIPRVARRNPCQQKKKPGVSKDAPGLGCCCASSRWPRLVGDTTSEIHSYKSQIFGPGTSDSIGIGSAVLARFERRATVEPNLGF